MNKNITPHMRAVAMLPNVPNEVFDDFILPFIDDIGWPFSNINDSIHKTDWWRLLGGLSLEEFSVLVWQRHSFFINENTFHPESNSDINRLVRYHVDGFRTSLIGNISKTYERFRWHVSYIERARRFCAPIVTIVTFNGLRLLDGAHRIAALLSLELYNEIPVDAWIGK